VIYFIKDTVTQAIKIGFSTKPAKRLAVLQTANPHKLIILGAVTGGHKDEDIYHDKFAQHRLEGEWFKGEIIEEVLSIIDAHKQVTRRIKRETMPGDNQNKVDAATPEEMNANEQGRTEKDSGIQGISRIPGLRMKSLSMKLTERPWENQPNYVACGVEIKYVLVFEKAVTNDPANNTRELAQLQDAFIVTNPHQQLRIRHVFLDEDNAMIPFGPAHDQHHVVGGQEAITGGEGEAFRVLVAYERRLDPNYSGTRIKDVFTGQNYAGEHPLKNAKKLVIAIR
jgi:hypothetical protein